jgi:hypothetical protein
MIVLHNTITSMSLNVFSTDSSLQLNTINTSNNLQYTSGDMEKPFVQPGEPLNEFLRSFWQRQINAAEQEMPDSKHPPLPIARIKKVMKSDPDVKVIIFINFAYPIAHDFRIR